MAKTDYEFSDVLISPREPFDKKTVWIHVIDDDDVLVKIFNKGWKIISRTKDIGLSDEAKNLVKGMNSELQALIVRILKKLLGKFSSSSNIVYERLKQLEERIKELEDKIDKMNKKYSTLRNNGK